MASITIRTAGDGHKSYKARVRIKGRPTATKTFSTMTAAKRWAAKLEQELRDGGSGVVVEATRHTLADAIDRYITEGRVEALKASTRPDYRRHLDWWRQKYGAYALAALTPAIVADAKASLMVQPKLRGEGALAPATVAKALRVLSTVIDHARREWHWIAANPVESVRPPTVRNARTRYLDQDELQRLLAAVEPVGAGGPCESADLQLAVLMALTTGARRGEVMGLTWKDIDLAKAVVTFRDTKNGETRSVALAPEVVDLLKTRPRRIGGALLFPAPADPKRPDRPPVPIDLRSAFMTALRRAEIEDFRWHDLRHSAASYMAMNGASLVEIAAVLGHKTLAMVRRYSHLSEEATATASSKIAGHIFGR